MFGGLVIKLISNDWRYLMKTKRNLINILLWCIILIATSITLAFMRPIYDRSSHDLESFRSEYRDQHHGQDPYDYSENYDGDNPPNIYFVNGANYYLMSGYLQNALLRIVAITCIILFLIAFSIPCERSKTAPITTFFTKLIPYELTAITAVITVILTITYGAQYIYDLFSTKNTLFDILSPNFWRITFFSVVLFISYTTIIGISLIFRSILQEGKVALHEHSFLCKNSIVVEKYIKRMYQYIKTIDFHDKRNRHLIILLILNYIVLSLLCLTWIAGIFFAFLYSLCLFYLIHKRNQRITADYTVLSDIIEQLAQGKLKQDINMDLGAFNSCKVNLQNLQNNFHHAVEQEVRSQNMKTELITNVSHDLKTPLTSIISYIDLLKKDDLSKEEHDKYISILQASSNRLKHLIDDLFEMSKANARNVTLNFMKLDIVSLLHQVQLDYENIFQQHNLILRNTFSSDKILLTLDSQKTYRIFDNLFSNISKYSLASTRVYVHVQEEVNDVSIAIKNISAVEPDFDSDNITERFVRGDKSRNTEGSGLGLAIAKSFTELQNGTIEIESEADLFKVLLHFPKRQNHTF